MALLQWVGRSHILFLVLDVVPEVRGCGCLPAGLWAVVDGVWSMGVRAPGRGAGVGLCLEVSLKH